MFESLDLVEVETFFWTLEGGICLGFKMSLRVFEEGLVPKSEDGGGT